MRFAIIGMGEIAYRAHVPAIHKLGGEITVTCDPNIGKRYGGEARHYADWRTMFDVASDDFDVAVIATPNYLHVPMALAALDAGKKVILEKPVALNMAQADELLAHPRVNDVAVCYQRRWNMDCQEIKKISSIDSIKDVEAVINVRRDPGYWNEWRKSKALSGGATLMNIAIHYLDLIQWWIGSHEMIVSHCKIADRRGIDQYASARFIINDIPITFRVSSLESDREIFMKVSFEAVNQDCTQKTYEVDTATHFDVYDSFLNHGKHVSVQEAVKSLEMVRTLYKFNDMVD